MEKSNIRGRKTGARREGEEVPGKGTSSEKALFSVTCRTMSEDARTRTKA